MSSGQLYCVYWIRRYAFCLSKYCFISYRYHRNVLQSSLVDLKLLGYDSSRMGVRSPNHGFVRVFHSTIGRELGLDFFWPVLIKKGSSV